jgi:ubiquinone/menaquinone biosynthesis C-methylase UbiE
MPQNAEEFSVDSVRREWDEAADAYAGMQAAGEDYYRYEFFGPALLDLCGDVAGRRVLDLGCGAGYFSRRLAERGASVVGVDISQKQIEHAIRRGVTGDHAIDYVVCDAAEIADLWPSGSYDLVTACVSLQDMPDPTRVIRAAHEVLRRGGRFVPLITHPCTDTPFREWERDEHGEKVALRIDRYFEHVALTYRWPARPQTPSFLTTGLHAPLGVWLDWCLDAGFRLRKFAEPRPSEEAVRHRPELMDAAKVPYFVGLDLVKE